LLATKVSSNKPLDFKEYSFCVGGFLAESIGIKSPGKIPGKNVPMGVWGQAREGIPGLLLEPVPNYNGFRNPTSDSGPLVTGLSGNMCDSMPLFIQIEDIHQHTQRGPYNRQERMRQDRKGFSRA